MTKLSRKLQTQKRHRRSRRFLIGNESRPRLSVYRSNNHIYAQVIDDNAQTTICAASTIDKELKGKTLVVSAGYSHPVEMIPPDGITYKVDSNTNVTVSGIDKEIVGNEAAKIRSIRPPEPYKGKGIKYQGERIIRKAGKSGKK